MNPLFVISSSTESNSRKLSGICPFAFGVVETNLRKNELQALALRHHQHAGAVFCQVVVVTEMAVVSAHANVLFA